MGFLFWILIAIHVLLSVVLVLLVLVQNDKGGGIAALAGGSSYSSQGAGAATFIQKLTRGIAFAFMLVILGINLYVSQQGKAQQVGSELKGAFQSEGLGGILPQEGPIQLDPQEMAE